MIGLGWVGLGGSGGLLAYTQERFFLKQSVEELAAADVEGWGVA